jgi:hypothetical protein
VWVLDLHDALSQKPNILKIIAPSLRRRPLAVKGIPIRPGNPTLYPSRAKRTSRRPSIIISAHMVMCMCSAGAKQDPE